MRKAILDLYTDGGARGNPGPAAAGAVIINSQGQAMEKLKSYLGEKTNNQAEYEALIFGLLRCQELGAEEVRVFLDSELLVRQLTGVYKIKNSALAPLAGRVLALVKNFKTVTFTHVPRQQNMLADQLVNQALDEAVGNG